jgi:hypothetical protein
LPCTRDPGARTAGDIWDIRGHLGTSKDVWGHLRTGGSGRDCDSEFESKTVSAEFGVKAFETLRDTFYIWNFGLLVSVAVVWAATCNLQGERHKENWASVKLSILKVTHSGIGVMGFLGGPVRYF